VAHRVPHQNNGEDFPFRLRLARKLRGLSGFQLAEKLGLAKGQQYISAIERGNHQNVSIGRVAQIAAALGVDPRWLAFGGPAAPEGIEQVTLSERRARTRAGALAA
jgi:transcriptional regulator with XRE-family HTH domain